MNNHTLWSYDSDIQRNKRHHQKLGKKLEQSLPLHLMQTFLIFLENSPKPSVNIKNLEISQKRYPEQVKEIKQEGQSTIAMRWWIEKCIKMSCHCVEK
jgi:ribosomal protein S7